MTADPDSGPGERPRLPLVEGHAFDAFDWRHAAVEDADWAMELDVTPRVVNSVGALHGGLLGALVDLTAGTALLRGPEPYGSAVTTELALHFLEAVRHGTVLASARVLRRGARSAVVRVDVSQGRTLVATATATFAVRPAS